MTKDIVVVGIGGTSRDVIETLESINRDKVTWNILGFVDDNPGGDFIMKRPIAVALLLLAQGCETLAADLTCQNGASSLP